MRRSVQTLLWLYPRAVRTGHGAELAGLVEELIDHDGAPRGRTLARLAADGLSQRVTALITAPLLVVVLALTSFGGLAICDITAASAHSRLPRHPSVTSARPAVRTPTGSAATHRAHRA